MNKLKEVTIEPKIQEALKNLGFTDYFINIYTTLLNEGELNAHDISEIAHVPYSRIYEIINDMIKHDMITKIDGRPSTFIANDPQDMFKALKKQRDLEFEGSMGLSLDFLKELYGEKTPVKKFEFIFYEGQSSCRDHLRTVINSTLRKLYLQILDFEEIYPLIKNNLDFLRSKGVETYLLVEERIRNEDFLKEIKNYAVIKFLANMSSNIVISDDKLALQGLKGHFNLAKPSEEDHVSFGSSHSIYIMYISEMFNRLWQKALE